MIALLVMFALLYARGWALMNRRHTWPTRRLRIQAFFFSGGMAAIVVTMISPLRALATEQQWAHMLQHAMLVLVSAPLLVLANPLPALLLGLPAPARRGLGEGWCCVTRLRPAWDLLSSPPAAPLLLAVVLFAWHTPGLYQAALADEGLHVLQHLSLLGAGILFWWMILRRPRAHRVSHKFVLQ